MSNAVLQIQNNFHSISWLFSCSHPPSCCDGAGGSASGQAVSMKTALLAESGFLQRVSRNRGCEKAFPCVQWLSLCIVGHVMNCFPKC